MAAIGILLLYAIFQPYKAKYTAYNKVTIATIAMMTISLFSAASITIATNKMYQAVTFSIALFGFTILISTTDLSHSRHKQNDWCGKQD